MRPRRAPTRAATPTPPKRQCACAHAATGCDAREDLAFNATVRHHWEPACTGKQEINARTRDMVEVWMNDKQYYFQLDLMLLMPVMA